MSSLPEPIVDAMLAKFTEVVRERLVAAQANPERVTLEVDGHGEVGKWKIRFPEAVRGEHGEVIRVVIEITSRT